MHLLCPEKFGDTVWNGNGVTSVSVDEDVGGGLFRNGNGLGGVPVLVDVGVGGATGGGGGLGGGQDIPSRQLSVTLSKTNERKIN